jgi:hypothetical protein
MAAEGIEGCDQLHHLPTRLRDALATARYRPALHYSVEDRELLGTGGALAFAADRPRNGTVLVRNSTSSRTSPAPRWLAPAIECDATPSLRPTVRVHGLGRRDMGLRSAGRRQAKRSTTATCSGYHLIEESIST